MLGPKRAKNVGGEESGVPDDAPIIFADRYDLASLKMDPVNPCEL